jgi:hypothetical protein
MHPDIAAYNAAQTDPWPGICDRLACELDRNLSKAESKFWHRTAVWFIDRNPIAGYAVRKKHVQLLFWSGQSFDDDGLEPEGSFKAAHKLYTCVDEIKSAELKGGVPRPSVSSGITRTSSSARAGSKRSAIGDRPVFFARLLRSCCDVFLPGSRNPSCDPGASSAFRRRRPSAG